jgi:hypothetical protein
MEMVKDKDCWWAESKVILKVLLLDKGLFLLCIRIKHFILVVIVGMMEPYF